MMFVDLHWTAHGDYWVFVVEAECHRDAERSLEMNSGVTLVFKFGEIAPVMDEWLLERIRDGERSLCVREAVEVVSG